MTKIIFQKFSSEGVFSVLIEQFKPAYQSRSLLSVKLDEVVDEVEEVAWGDGHDAAAAFQRPLVCGVKSLVDVHLLIEFNRSDKTDL